MEHALSCDSRFLATCRSRLRPTNVRSHRQSRAVSWIRLLVDTRTAQRCRMKNNKHILAGRGQPAMLSLRYISFVSGSREGVWVNELRSVKNKRERERERETSAHRCYYWHVVLVPFLRFPNREYHASELSSSVPSSVS